MKWLLEGTLLVAGLPNLISIVLVGGVAGCMMRHHKFENTDFLLACVDVACGLVSVFVGSYLVQSLGLEPGTWLPMLLAAWFGWHFIRLNRTGQFVLATGGVCCGWLLAGIQ